MAFPVLTTPRLTLAELTLEEVEPLYQHFSDPDVVKFYDLEAFTTINQAQELMELFRKRYREQTGIRWAIRLNNSHDFIGTCGFNSWNKRMRSAVIGYDITKSQWGRGYATEALNAILQHGFNGQLPCGELNRIQADTLPGNAASEAVLIKNGFKEEGLLRQSGYWKGMYHDLKCFGLLRSEYNAIRSVSSTVLQE